MAAPQDLIKVLEKVLKPIEMERLLLLQERFKMEQEGLHPVTEAFFKVKK